MRRCRQKIVDDLDVTDVLDHLLANEVVNEEQMEEIFSRPTRVARARCLLDVLVKRGPNLLQFFPVINLLTPGPKAFPVFLDSLRDNYSWLVEFMMENHAVDGGQKTVVRFQSKDFLSLTARCCRRLCSWLSFSCKVESPIRRQQPFRGKLVSHRINRASIDYAQAK